MSDEDWVAGLVDRLESYGSKGPLQWVRERNVLGNLGGFVWGKRSALSLGEGEGDEEGDCGVPMQRSRVQCVVEFPACITSEDKENTWRLLKLTRN